MQKYEIGDMFSFEGNICIVRELPSSKEILVIVLSKPVRIEEWDNEVHHEDIYLGITNKLLWLLIESIE